MKNLVSSKSRTDSRTRILICTLILLATGLTQANGQQLQLGDGVRLTFYNIEDNVSGDYFILNDGTLQLPYIGIVNTFERPFKSLQESIIYSYQSIYKDPELNSSATV